MMQDIGNMLLKINIFYRSATRLFLVMLLVNLSFAVHAQSDKKFIRQGNREYAKKEYPESEISYRKAADKNKMSPNAVFNIGDALYRQKKYEDAGKQFMESTSRNEDKVKKADGYYNLGNSLLQANKIQESIDAYKNSLKLDPGNMEAKYNLAYAQDLLRMQQQQQQQQQKQQKDNKDNKDNKNNKDKQQQDNQKDNNKQQQNNQQNNQDKTNPQNQQNQQQQISKEDAERLLNALANDEKKVEEKVKLAKAAKEKVRTVKNW